MFPVAPLECEECGCKADDRAAGWAAYLGDDPDGREPTCVVVYCPPCAASHFGYRPRAAVHYT